MNKNKLNTKKEWKKEKKIVRDNMKFSKLKDIKSKWLK